MPADVFFTTNPAEFTRLEGLYISERNPPGFIRGRDLSAVGMFGLTIRGPSTVQKITSTSRFIEIYGGRDQGTSDGLALTNEVWAALINKPFGTLYVRRVTGAGAVVASLTLDDLVTGLGTDIVRVDASSVGIWGDNIKWKVEDASDGDALKWNAVTEYLGEQVTYENLNTQAGFDNLAEVIGDDVARQITLTKLSDGRPQNSTVITEAAYVAAIDADGFVTLGDTTLVTNFSQIPGTEGTLAVGDYTTALGDMAVTDGPSVVLCPESLEDTITAGAQSTLNGAIVTQAAIVSDRTFVTWSGIHGQVAATEITSLTTDITTRSDRIVWCFNSPKTLDPEVAVKIDQGPHIWMASILSQNDVDIHPGSQQSANQTAGISELNNETLTRADLISLREAGISTLEKLPGQFLFRSGVTTDLTTGKTEITRRRMADFLQLSASDRLRFFVKAKNTLELRAQIAGELTAFSQSLRDQGRVIEDFAIEQDSVNTAAQRAQGIEKVFWRVRLLGHVLHLVLETEIGTGVVIEVAA